MKTLILAALAATTMAGTAHAQSLGVQVYAGQAYGNQGYSGDHYGYAPVAYGDDGRMYDRVLRHIDRARHDGRLDRRSAGDFRRQADQVRQHAQFARQRGVYDPREVAGRYDQLLARIDGSGQRYGDAGQNGWQDGDRRDGQYGQRPDQRDADAYNRDAYNRDPNAGPYPRW